VDVRKAADLSGAHVTSTSSVKMVVVFSEKQRGRGGKGVQFGAPPHPNSIGSIHYSFL
jgi:hypothetical protein